MRQNSKRQIFFKKPRSNISRIFLWVFLIVGAFLVYRNFDTGKVVSPFAPTPTVTRTANSFALEGDTHFTAGNLDDALSAYQEAVRIDPANAEIWTKLARIQAYTSNLLTTDAERNTRLAEALESATRAVELAPDSSQAHAIRAFVLDWNASPLLFSTSVEKQNEGQRLLVEAEQEAQRALSLDSSNTLALAFYAEILTDEQKLTQAQTYIEQALQRDSSLMDVHRVYANLLEAQGRYRQAIEEWDKAILITPNMTFLYIRAGAIFRHLGSQSLTPGEDPTKNPLLVKSLEYFDKAASINEQLGINDPIPYLSISKTYSQMGQFYVAGRNVLKALSFDQANPDVYGQLGIVYFKSRNYEGSLLPFQCALRGCTPEESCEARGGCDADLGEYGVEVNGLPLSNSTLVYYYTYGSVLAALSRPRQNYCPDAMQIFSEVRSQYGGDAYIVSNIIEPGENICRNLDAKIQGLPTFTPEPSSTPEPTP